MSASAKLRWTLEQIYVNKVISEKHLPDSLTVNRKGGCTISVKKRGGWSESFSLGQKLAGWI